MKKPTKQYRPIVILALLLATATATGQNVPNVLFIGNSYTEVNNLPQMTADVARSMGQSFTWSSNTPGGCTFNQHCNNQSMTMIQRGGWDFVVLQEQSQYPSFPQWQVEAEVFPYAAQLVAAAYAASPCCEPMFYMTWGRKYGDADNAGEFPVLGTYEGMDSMLCLRYMQMGADNDASVCPVGRVWHYLRDNHPGIELYQRDNSHPSVAGTYAAACSFYVMFFGGDPAQITNTPSSLDPGEAATIRQAVREVVYSDIGHWRRQQPHANITLHASAGLDATLLASGTGADSLVWDFGDGQTVTTADSLVSHTYADSGAYRITLVALRRCMTDTAHLDIHIGDTPAAGIPEAVRPPSVGIHPNPTAVRPVVTIGGYPVDTDERRATLTAADGRRYSLRQFDNLPAGVYLLTIVRDNQIHTGKIIKQ